MNLATRKSKTQVMLDRITRFVGGRARLMIVRFGLALMAGYGCVGAANAQSGPAPQGPLVVQTHSGLSADVGTLQTSSTNLMIRAESNYPVDSYLVSNGVGDDLRQPLKMGATDFSPTNFATPSDAARFKALDLSTPMPLRTMRGDTVSAELTFSAAGSRTGLGFDVQAAPRAQIQRNQAGGNVARLGGEIRLGQGLEMRDQRGKGIQAPAWYFFVGADNEALVWNVADRQSLNGLALRDDVTVGDFQAGVAFRSFAGGQMSVGLVQRKLKFNDMTGDRDVRRKENFAAFTFSLRR